MAVAYTSDFDFTPATGTSIQKTSYAISGTNPVVIFAIALKSTSATVSSVAVSAGLTSGTPVEVKTLRDGDNILDSYVSLWAIPAPSGTGTITATLSASVPWQANLILFSGAHQTTPCPTGDAVSVDTNTTTMTLTPTNLTANDAAVGIGANTDGDNPTWNQTQTFQNNTTAVNAAAGYHLGTGSVSITWGSTGSQVMVAARIQEASGGATTISTGVGSVPQVGQTPLLAFAINMPDQA